MPSLPAPRPTSTSLHQCGREGGQDGHEPLSAQGWRIALVVSLAMFLSLLDEAIVVTVLPQIARDFSVPPLSLAPAISIYMTGAATLLPASGWLAERYGVRRSFIAATMAFGAVSLVCALAPDYLTFIAARAVQGMAGGMMAASGRLILMRALPQAQYVAALNLATVPMLVGPTIGPALGGFIVTWSTWPVAFLINVPITVLACLAALAFVPAVPPATDAGLDQRGALLAGAAMALTLAGLAALGGSRSADASAATWSLTLLAAGIIAGVCTWRHLRVYPAPLVSLDPLASPSFRAAALTAGILLRLPLRSLSYVLPLLFQIGFGMPPLRAGLLVMALAAGDLLFKPVVVPIYRRAGHWRALLASGSAALAACAITLAFTRDWPFVATAVVILCIGMARSVLFTGLSTLGTTQLPPAQLASANVLMSISQQLIGALGVALATLVLRLSAGATAPGDDDFRWATAALLACGFAGLWNLYKTRQACR